MASLVDFYEYLEFDKYRYVVTTITLKYEAQSTHNQDNITNLLRHLNRYYKDKDQEKIPLHSIWKLEHRSCSKVTEKAAAGFHYHLTLIFNRDITPSNKKLVGMVRKFWGKHYGDIFISNKVHLTPTMIDKIEAPFHTKYLDKPVYNTEVNNVVGVFHHMSYLTKHDTKQKLPEEYKGKGFNISKLDASKLTRHSKIKARSLTIKMEIDDSMLDDYSTTIPFDNEIQEQFYDLKLPF